MTLSIQTLRTAKGTNQQLELLLTGVTQHVHDPRIKQLGHTRNSMSRDKRFSKRMVQSLQDKERAFIPRTLRSSVWIEYSSLC